MGVVRVGPPDRSERGQALVGALVAVVLVGAAFAVLAGLLIARMHRVRDEVRRTELTALADAAMAETLANLAASPVYPGVAERELDGGTIRSEVRHGAGGSFTIRVRAAYRGGVLAAEARGRQTPTGPRVTSWRRIPAPDESPEATRGGRIPPPER
ncbi:MAG: hypothetical protein PVG07_13975 [Acidobacteriota bacterium]|jgi:hypothetical protein